MDTSSSADNTSDTSENNSVSTDLKNSAPSSSRLLSASPSFPAHPTSSLPSSLSSSHPSSSPSLSLPSRTTGPSKKLKTKPVCYFSSPGIFQRLCITALAHPFLVVSVKMVTNPELRNQNWIYSYLHIVTRHGFGGLYSGIRYVRSNVMYVMRSVYAAGCRIACAVPDPIPHH